MYEYGDLKVPSNLLSKIGAASQSAWSTVNFVYDVVFLLPGESPWRKTVVANNETMAVAKATAQLAEHCRNLEIEFVHCSLVCLVGSSRSAHKESGKAIYRVDIVECEGDNCMIMYSDIVIATDTKQAEELAFDNYGTKGESYRVYARKEVDLP